MTKQPATRVGLQTSGTDARTTKEIGDYILKVLMTPAGDAVKQSAIAALGALGQVHTNVANCQFGL